MKLRIYSDVKVHLNDDDKLKQNIVYKLEFPDGSTYIGATSQLFRNRLIDHCAAALDSTNRRFNNPKETAIRNNMELTASILYIGNNYKNMEIIFISKERELNSLCLNISAGGDGASYEKSDETKQKISESKYKPVEKYTKNGVFVDEFKAMTDAAENAGVSVAAMSMWLSGKRKGRSGFVWK